MTFSRYRAELTMRAETRKWYAEVFSTGEDQPLWTSRDCASYESARRGARQKIAALSGQTHRRSRAKGAR